MSVFGYLTTGLIGLGLGYVGYRLLVAPAAPSPPRAPLTGGLPAALGGTPTAARQFTAGPLSPSSPLGGGSTGLAAKPSDFQTTASLVDSIGKNLPGLVTAIGTQVNEADRISNAQDLALLDRQRPPSASSPPAAATLSSVLRAPPSAEQPTNIFAASSGQVLSVEDQSGFLAAQNVDPNAPGFVPAPAAPLYSEQDMNLLYSGGPK